ncbi:MAG: exodeoxyribonuclease V subunit gamma [Candidatus Thiodiazotropha sp.]
MLWLYQSNRLENLALRLTDLLGQPLADPLQAETVVVQHPGMARWLSLQIADRLGICANLEFPQPAAFIWQLFYQWLPDAPDQDRYRPDVLSWRIHAKLPHLVQQPLFADLAAYLAGNGEEQGFQLAQQLAKLFDRYLLYRPDWIVAWQEGRSAQSGDHWQASLWRELFADVPVHWVTLQQQCLALAQGDGAPAGLPERVCIFGVPTLSPGYLEILRQLSEWTEVHLFLLNPCAQHWADILSESEQARRALRGGSEALYLDLGHPLLAMLGRQGRDFFAAINEMNPGGEELFETGSDASLLQRLQQQIVNLEMPQQGVPADASIGLHLCHSPMREVEVLYDLLLDALDHVADLRPDEILVMTPDIDRYAPLMEAVFGAPGGRPRIPFRISDTRLGQASPLAAAFLELLALPDSRYGVDEFLRLLEIPAIRTHFNLDDACLSVLQPWLKTAAVRWGRDGRDKAEQGLPADEHNTWQSGIRQLLLGYMMPGDTESLWQGVYPLDAAEGSSLACLNGLLSFCDTLFDLELSLGQARNPSDWLVLLTGILQDCFASDPETQQSLLPIHDAIRQLSEEMTLANYPATIPLPVIRQRLSELFDQTQIRGFLGGGVNLCALAPMRSLPFRVVALIGLNDGVFPRGNESLGFDLMNETSRFGDRSRRMDDRYLFLETLMSVRERLLIIYQGFDQRDNSIKPPSVVVDELQDCLQRMLGESGLEAITCAHPLQPFSPAYFQNDPQRFSYDPHMREAAMNLGYGQNREASLVPGVLPDGSIDPVVELDRLIAYFENPQRSFVQQRLGMSLESLVWMPQARENFELESFQDVNWGDVWVDALLEGHSGEDLIARYEARGWLPYGDVGTLYAQAILRNAEALADRVRPLLTQASETPLVVQFQLQHGVLQGQIERIYQSGLLAYTSGNFSAFHLLGHWIRHLLLNALKPQGAGLQTQLISPTNMGRFHPVIQPVEVLDALLDLYRQGLKAPTLFSPRSAMTYMEQLDAGSEDKALKAVQKTWFGGERLAGDVDKPYMQLLFPQRPAPDHDFTRISRQVMGPLLEHLEWEGP